jgi:hypothetical protein
MKNFALDRFEYAPFPPPYVVELVFPRLSIVAIIRLVEGVPYVVMATTWMNEVKWIKYSVIGGLRLLAILQEGG